MNADHDDPILDACLDEVLASRTPPDVAPRVLRALRDAAAPPPPVQPRVLAPLASKIAPALVSITPHGDLQARQIAAPASQGYWPTALAVALAAGILGVGLTIGLASLFRGEGAVIVQKSPASAAKDSASPEPGVGPRLATNSPAQKPVATLALSDTQGDQPSPAQLAFDSPTNPTPSAADATLTLPVERAPRSPAPSEQIVTFVNAELTRVWTSAGVSASPAISDDEWCARVFQRTLGRTATAAELNQFQSDEASSRRDLLLDRVLGEQYHNAFSRHWARVLATELLGSAVARTGSLGSRPDLEKYLTAALRTNKPLTAIVTDLLTATGASQPGASYNPAVNFLLDGWEPTAMVATSRVARVFLGQRLECAQCHEHPTEGRTQDQFWSMNAFFRQMRAEKTEASTRLSDVDFPGQRRGSRDGEVFYETPAGLVKTAYPRFLDGTEIATSGQLSIANRRRELARLITQSEYLPRAMVNHVWAHYFDYGLLPSLHDLGESASPLHADLLNRLSTEFAASGLDLKNLIRWTVMSDAFVRSSKLTDLATKDMPEAGEPALFSRYYSRPRTSADVLTSLVQAQRIRRTAGTTAERDQARVDWLSQYNRSAAKDGAKKAAQTSSILAESSTIRVTAGLQTTGMVPTIAAHTMTFEQKVEHLFLAALGRRPAPRESRTAATVLTTAGDNHQAALEDIWWSLLNSDECILDR